MTQNSRKKRMNHNLVLLMLVSSTSFDRRDGRGTATILALGFEVYLNPSARPSSRAASISPLMSRVASTSPATMVDAGVRLDNAEKELTEFSSIEFSTTNVCPLLDGKEMVARGPLLLLNELMR